MLMWFSVVLSVSVLIVIRRIRRDERVVLAWALGVVVAAFIVLLIALGLLDRTAFFQRSSLSRPSRDPAMSTPAHTDQLSGPLPFADATFCSRFQPFMYQIDKLIEIEWLGQYRRAHLLILGKPGKEPTCIGRDKDDRDRGRLWIGS
jgi:hypothetical protein